VYFVHIHSLDEVFTEEMAQRARKEYSVCVNSGIEKLRNEEESVYSLYLSAQEKLVEDSALLEKHIVEEFRSAAERLRLKTNGILAGCANKSGWNEHNRVAEGI